VASKPPSQVGLFYSVKGQLWIDTTPLPEAGDYAGFKIHERGHLAYWSQLVSRGVVPDDEYEVHPRGRVVYHTASGQYTLYADRCILRRKDLVSKVMAAMQLPRHYTRTATDDHYRCERCLSYDFL